MFDVFRKIAQRLHDHRQTYLHAKANRMAFRSGLGDSCDLLYGLVRSMKPQLCVEIGSARSKSASFIGLALKQNGGGKLMAIDPHARTDWNDSDSVDTFEIITHNLGVLQLNEQVEIVRQTSDAAPRTGAARST